MKKYVEDFIDFGPGKQFFSSGIHIEYYKTLQQQVGILREDMLQIHYGNEAVGYVIDVGWYGRSFSLNGFFRVSLVQDDWSTPLVTITCKSVKRLVPAIRICVERLRAETCGFRLLPAQGTD